MFLSIKGTICYDDGCHLKKYAINPARSTLTVTASRIASMNFAIDRMHFKGHIDPWCHEHCDPNKLKELEKVRSYIHNTLSESRVHVHAKFYYLG